MKDVGDKVWIAEAPAGRSSQGPVVIWELDNIGVNSRSVVASYREMGYAITEALIIKAAKEE